MGVSRYFRNLNRLVLRGGPMLLVSIFVIIIMFWWSTYNRHAHCYLAAYNGFYRASSALAVYAMVVCLSVCPCARLSVRHKSEFY